MPGARSARPAPRSRAPLRPGCGSPRSALSRARSENAHFRGSATRSSLSCSPAASGRRARQPTFSTSCAGVNGFWMNGPSARGVGVARTCRARGRRASRTSMRSASSNASISGITTSVTSRSIGPRPARASSASLRRRGLEHAVPRALEGELMTSRTTSWSSTTSTVSAHTRAASPRSRPRAIPGTGCAHHPRPFLPFSYWWVVLTGGQCGEMSGSPSSPYGTHRAAGAGAAGRPAAAR